MRAAAHAAADIDSGVEPDLTPMIDIVFQLVIFFLVANDLTRKEVELVKLPQAAHGSEDLAPEPWRVIINIVGPPRDARHADPPLLFPDRAPAKVPRVRIKGIEYDLDGLVRYLRTQADLTREPPGVAAAPSTTFALVRADTDTPWRHVQYVMQACAEKTVRIYRMQFATTARSDGRPVAADPSEDDER